MWSSIFLLKNFVMGRLRIGIGRALSLNEGHQ